MVVRNLFHRPKTNRPLIREGTVCFIYQKQTVLLDLRNGCSKVIAQTKNKLSSQTWGDSLFYLSKANHPYRFEEWSFESYFADQKQTVLSDARGQFVLSIKNKPAFQVWGMDGCSKVISQSRNKPSSQTRVQFVVRELLHRPKTNRPFRFEEWLFESYFADQNQTVLSDARGQFVLSIKNKSSSQVREYTLLYGS